MPPKKQKKNTHQSKSFYIYMALVTMTVVHFFAKPFKKGMGILKRRLQKASQGKNSLRAQLSLNQSQQPVFSRNSALRISKRRKNVLEK